MPASTALLLCLKLGLLYSYFQEGEPYLNRESVIQTIVTYMSKPKVRAKMKQLRVDTDTDFYTHKRIYDINFFISIFL